MRRDIPERIKKLARARAAGLCENCHTATGPSNPPDVDHRKADSEGGEPTLENAWVLGRKCCHDTKTALEAKRRAKANRQRARHLDTKVRKGRPLPGTKASGIRKRMDGTVEKR